MSKAKKAKPKPGDIVSVKWLDSCTPSRCWQLVDDAKAYRHLKCASVGFFVKQDARGLIIAQSIGDSEVGNILAIPPSCVQSMKVLGRAKRG